MSQHILFEQRPKVADLEEDTSSFSCFAPIRELKSELKKVVWIPPGGMVQSALLIVVVVFSSSVCVYLADLLGSLLLRGLSALFGLIFI